MQKVTVIESEVMHSSCTAQNSDGAKLFEGFSAQSCKTAHSDPAKNPARENGHFADGNNSTSVLESHSQVYNPHSKPEKDLCSNIRSIGGVRPKRIGAFLTRAFAVILAAVMTVSLGAFTADMLDTNEAANDSGVAATGDADSVLGVLGTGAQSAYAATGTTPYTNIDVPLSTHSDNASNSSGANANDANNGDNANPIRVETDNGTDYKDTQEAGILGPYKPSVSSRNSDGDPDGADPNEDAPDPSADQTTDEADSTFTDGGLTYTRNEAGDDEDHYTYTLTYADPKIGKVAVLPSDVTAIAEGAFIDCPDLETIIVLGNIRSIAKAERDFFGNITRQGAFTDDQIENVHVVFAVNTLTDHNHDHGDNANTDNADSENDVDADNTNDEFATNSNTDDANSETIADQSTDKEDETPVVQGVKRLSGDVRLSTPKDKSSKQNLWAETGFKNIVANPNIGTQSKSFAYAPVSQNESTQNLDIQDASIQDGFIFTLLSDYTLEVAWNSDKDVPSDLTIPDYSQVEGTTYEVTQIKEGAFKGNETLQTLTIKDNVECINSSAFENCKNLGTVTLPDTLISIGDNAFRATSISEIQIPDTVVSIGEYAFADCANLTQATQRVTKSEGDDETNEKTNNKLAEGDGGKTAEDANDGASQNVDAETDEKAASEQSGGHIASETYESAESERAGTYDGSTDKADGSRGKAQSIAEIESQDNAQGATQDGHEPTSPLAKAFEGSPVQVDGRIARTAYADDERDYPLFVNKKNHIAIDANGGTWSGEHYTSASAETGKKESIDGLKGERNFYFGHEGGYLHLSGETPWTNNWTSTKSGKDDARKDAAFFSASRAHYDLDRIEVTTPKKTGESFYCSECSRDIYDAGNVDPNGGSKFKLIWVPFTYWIDYGPNKPGSTAVIGEMDSTPCDYDANVTLPQVAFSASGYTFKNWNIEKDGTGTSYNDKDTVKNLSGVDGATVKLYAQWTANTYTVTLDGNGGTPPDPSSVTVTFDQNYPNLGRASRPGHDFLGWFTAPSGGSKIEADTKCTTASNHTLYAHWQIHKHDLTLTAGTGIASVSGGGSDINYNAQVSASATPSTGYHFANWSGTYSSTSNPYSFKMPDQDVALTANGAPDTYTVTLDPVGGTADNASVQVTYDSCYPELGGASLEGHKFLGWFTASIGGEKVETTTVCKTASNHTLYAHWEIIKYKLTVIAGDNISSVSGGGEMEYNAPVSVSATPTKGHHFVNWIGTYGSTFNPYAFNMPANDVTLTANGAPNPYKVTYNKNRPRNASNYVTGTTGDPNNQSSHIYGKPQDLAKHGFELTGWTQKGWNTNADGTGKHYDLEDSVVDLTDVYNGVVNLYAEWVANTYTISYHSNFSASTYRYSKPLFDGVLNETAPIKTMQPSTHTYDTPKNLTANLYGVTGYKFDNWYRNANCTGNYYTDTLSVANLASTQGADVPLFAKWAKETYRININTVGGTMPSATPTSYTIDSAPIFIGNPSKKHYDFAGWSVTGAGQYGSQPLATNNGMMIPQGTYGNLSFTAAWSIIEYTVNYHFNGGTGNAILPVTVKYDQTFQIATGTDRIFKEGHTFSGYWNTQSDGSGQGYEEGTSKSGLTPYPGSIFLYAIWNANQYDLTLNVNCDDGRLTDGTGWTPNANRTQSTKKVTYGQKVGTLLEPTRPGYTTNGWLNEANEPITSSTVYDRAAPMTLHPDWEPNVYSIHFNKNAAGAVGSVGSITGVKYNQELPLPDSGYTYTGHTLEGWSRDQKATVPEFGLGEAVSKLTTENGGSVLLYAVWSENHYSVNYYSNGADIAEGFDEPYQVKDIPYTERFYPPDASALGYSLTGYTFAGWSDAEDGSSGKLYKPVDAIPDALTDADDVTVNLWAIWTPNVYKLTLNATGGRFDQTLFQAVGQIWSPETNYVGAYRQIKFDEEYKNTIEPTRAGYDFAGWYPYEQKDKYTPGPQTDRVSASDLYKALEDTTLYAHWDPHVYTLNLAIYNTYTHKDDILLIKQLRFNEEFVLPHREYEFTEENGATALSAGKQLSSFRMSGYALAGWSNTAADTKAYYGLGEKVFGLHPGVSSADTTDPTVFTLYLIQTSGSFTVEFDPNVPEGEEIQNPMLPPKEPWRYNTDNPIPNCTMKRPGYSFTYWTGPDGIEYYPGTTQRINVSADLDLDVFVLTANWVANTIDIFFVDTGEVKSVMYDSPAQTIRASSTKDLAAEMHCVFEGWWTMKGDSFDEMYFGLSGQINTKIPQISPKWRDPGEKNSGGGNNRVYLYAKWTFQVTFEFPYGGEDPGVRPQNYTAGLKYGDESNADNYYPSHGLPTPKYNGLDSSKDETGAVRRFAGWYTEPVGGELVTDDSYALGPVEKVPGQGIEDVVLYARWYVDVTLDYPEYAPYTEGWAFEYGRDLAHVENGRGQTVVTYVQGIPYRGDASFQLGLPLATRVGYEHLGWNADERKAILDGESRLFEGEIQSGDIVMSKYNYTIHLEYARKQVDVKVRYWQQVIEGVDADGNPTTGLVPALASDDTYTSNGHYRLVEDATRDITLFSEEQIDDADYHEDPATEDARYRGFTYHTTLISKDANEDAATDPSALLTWNGATTPDQAKDNVYDGCTAADGTSVIDVFYTRNKYDITLHDFEITDGAGLTQVRGSAHVRANSSNNLAYSPTEAAEVPGRKQELSAWFEEEITAVGRSWPGYDFSGWDIEPIDLGYSKDVVNGDPDVRLEGDVYMFAVTDSDLDITPRCAARDDTPYHATLHYQNLTSATSVEDDRDAWATSSRVRFTGTTDALTEWVLRADAAAADAQNVIESKPVSPADFDAAGFPEDATFDETYVFDPHGFTGSELENTVIRADSDEAIHVYYTRNAYPVEVLGYEAAHRDGTPVGEIGRIEAYLWDNLKGDLADEEDAAGADAGEDGADGDESDENGAGEDGDTDPNKTGYRIYFHAPVSVVAIPHAGTELLGYTSSIEDIWSTKTLAAYAQDIGIELDGNIPEDSTGLANTNPNNPYTFKYDGSTTRRNMPVVPVTGGEQETLTLTVQGQPARTSYEVVVMQEAADTETEPAYGTYTQYGQTKVFDTIAAKDGGPTRLVRYWTDGTYVDANREDADYVPEITGFAPTGSYTPALYGYETYNSQGIVDLTELTPEGNAAFHGPAAAPLNKAYIYMDRMRPLTLGYSYVVSDEYRGISDLTDTVTSTLPDPVATYFGAEVGIAGDQAANGWEFKGWTWAEDPDTGREDWPRVGEGTDSERVTIPDFDVDVIGTWAPIEYGLTFDGGTAYAESPASNIPADMSIPFNSKWTVPDVEPERGGYTFLGWTFADRAVFEAIAGSAADLVTGDVDQYKASLASLNDFDGNPLILEPGQSHVWSWWKGDRTLHAVWMRNTYNITFDLADGGWPTGTTVPLTYMTGAEVHVPAPARDGYAFTGWDVTCDGSALDGDKPAVSYTDGDPTRAVINKWTYGNMTFTAQYDVIRYAVDLNSAGGTFDGEPESFMDKAVDYSSPDDDGAYGQATVYIPFDTEITASTPLPEPERPGYDFAGWRDADGNPVGWTLDDEGNKVEAPYTFDDAKDATWIATWRAHRYDITYDFGEHKGVTINNIDAFSEYYAGMTDADGNAITSFMLPTAEDLIGLPENVGFDGWCPKGGNPDSDRMRSFDPNTETGDKEFVAIFSTGANEYTERFWLEVLDQAEDDPDKQYAFIGSTRFALDDTLTVTRRTNSPNAQASMSAISGFVSVNPYDESGVSIYPTEHPYVCVFSAGQSTVNGFYTRETHSLTVGTADGIDDAGTVIEVSPASALVADAVSEPERDAAANTATLKGASRATVKWGAKVSVGVTCPRSSGYAFTAWRTDSGATPADIDVRANPAAFTMPDADVVLVPSTEPVRFTATYKDIFGKDITGAGQTEFTVKDEFALKNLDGIPGYTFAGWEAYAADSDGNRLDPAVSPVPETVGYDDDLEYMRVRKGTATDLLFEARYTAVGYTVSVTLPKGTAYLPSGMPDGLPQIDGIEWMLMSGDGANTDVIGFNYTIEDLGEPLVIDLTGINCAPYKVDRWSVAGEGGETNMPELEGGVLTLTNGNLGNWSLTPDASPIEYTLTLDLSDVRDGYVPLDPEEVKAGLEAAGYKVEYGEVPGTLDVTFDVESVDPYTLPSFEKEDPDSTPEHAFRGWAKDGDSANALNPYILPPSDIASWPETGTVIRPVWAKAGEQSTLIAHLPNNEGDYTDDYRFTFTGDALTPIDYAQDGRFLDIVNDVDDVNVGYHLVWHTDGGLTEESVTALPTNFPESGTQEVWGQWVEDDDIITVGFGVKWDNSAPPGEVKPRSAFALRSADMAAAADDAAAYTDDADSDAVAFSARSAYAGDAAAHDNAAGAAEADGASGTTEAGTGASFYYIPNKGLYTKDANGKYHIVTRISNIDEISGTYAGWRLEGFYLPIDTTDPERIIIGPDGTVDNAALVEVAGAKPSDLTFTVRWARISLVQIDMMGGYGDASEDLTLYYWPEKDVFVKSGDDAIGDTHSAPRTYAKDDFNTGVMLGTFAARGIPEDREDADGTRAFLGYFGETSGHRWDFAKDAEGNPLPTVDALALTPTFSYLAVTDNYKKQAAIGADAIGLPYGYAETNADPESGEQAQAYDPASADGTTHVTWRAAWEGDLDAVYFNATVPMSMSFMVKSDGTAIGPDAGAYQIRNYSNCPITVEDMSFAWADESELEALFGKGAADALALSATPTDGQEGYAKAKVLLERSKATQDAVGSELISKYIFSTDKWVIAKSIGIHPDDFAQAGGDASILPALKLDYELTTGGIKQLTQENASQDTTHRIGTLKFTLKTAR